MRKYIDVPNKETRDLIVRILGKEKVIYDRRSKPECNYVAEEDFPKIKHLLDIPVEASKVNYNGDPYKEFKAFLESHGVFMSGYPIMNGKKQSLVDKKKVWGQYCGYADGKPNGWIRDFTSGSFEICLFNGDIQGHISKAEIAQKSYEDFISKAELQRKVGKTAHWLWENKGTDKKETTYSERKKVSIGRSRITDDGSIMVDIRNPKNYITTLQFIRPDGSKKMLEDGLVCGSFHRMGYIAPKSTIILCEGWATGRTLHEQLNEHPVICSMTSGNMPNVAQYIQKFYPDNKVFIAVDNDRFQKNAKENINSGLVKALESQEILGERAVLGVPDFDDSLYIGEQLDLIDWNDFFIEYGKDCFLKEWEKIGLKPKRLRKKKKTLSDSH